MKKKISSILLMLMLVFPLVLVSTGSSANKTNIITVDDDGDADFSIIQEAIDSASPGDTVYVHSGTYFEHLLIEKTITIIGENKETTIIDGNYTGTIIQVSAYQTDIVTLSNLTIQNSGSNLDQDTIDSGLESTEACLYLSNNIFINNTNAGIYILSGFGPIIKNNLFKNSKVYSIIGGFIESGKITHNNFEGSGHPLYLMFCLNTEISNNHFEGGMYSILANILFIYCVQLTISHNEFATGSYGILAIDGADSSNMITENNFMYNDQFFVKTNTKTPFASKIDKNSNTFYEMTQKTQYFYDMAEMWYNSPFSNVLTTLNGITTLSGGSTLDSNYYTYWNGRGKFMIKGINIIIIKIPFIIILPWATFDSNPASEPYSID
jgi:parallel beta-helix repeat protein